MLAGEKNRRLADEFGITEAAIRKRFGAQAKQIKAVANQLVEAEQNFRALPVSAQIQTKELFHSLLEVSNHLLGAAKFGASTAHRLAGIANAKVAEIPDGELDAPAIKSLQEIAVLTKTANEASTIGINLIKANKEAVDEMSKPPADNKVKTLSDFYGDGE